MTDLYRCGSDYYSGRDYTGHRDATLADAAKRACDVGMLHLFQEPGNANKVASSYVPITETISKEGGEFLDKNGSKPVPVKGILLLGSNHLLWRIGEDDLHLDTKTMKITLSEKVGAQVVPPEWAEIVAFAATLRAKTIFDRHNIPSAIFYMPSDLPSGLPVGNVQEVRLEYKQKKVIDPIMTALVRECGFSNLPVVSNQELQNNPAAKGLISSGQAIWYALESEFRKRAGKLLEELVKKGIESVAEKFFPGSLGEWRAQNRESGYCWNLFLVNGTYTLKISSKHEKPVYIPIGAEMALEDGRTTPGSPKCALITSALLMACESLNFSHIFAAFHKDEVPVASGGFFIGRRLFGVQMHTYALGINRDILSVESSGRDGQHAANRDFLKDPWHLEVLDKATKNINKKTRDGSEIPEIYPYGKDGKTQVELAGGKILAGNLRNP